MIALFLAPVYILINIYIIRWILLWMSACSPFFQNPVFQAVFLALYTLFSTSLLTGFLIKKPRLLHRFLKNAANYFLGTFMYIILVVSIMDLGRILLNCTLHPAWLHTRTAFILSGSLGILLVMLLSINGIIHSWTLKLTPYDITVKKQVPGMDSLKVVLLADIHFGYSTGRIHAARLVRKINQLDADLICIAGDIFDNDFDSINKPDEVALLMRHMKSRYGVYACWGNHDVNEPVLAGFTFRGSKEDSDDCRMGAFLKDAHIRLLNDETILIDDKFYLAGRKDFYRAQEIENGRMSPAQLTAKLDRSRPVIVMDHQPKELQALADAGVDLDLCGHTHNGQIFPGNLTIHLFWENAWGYLRKDNMHNIVTSGAGIWGPNMRIGTDNEICVITVHFTS